MLEKLANQLKEDINQVFGDDKPDASKINSLLEAALRKLNLVTREEFDAQQAVLMRSREQLDKLELRLAELEENLSESSSYQEKTDF